MLACLTLALAPGRFVICILVAPKDSCVSPSESVNKKFRVTSSRRGVSGPGNFASSTYAIAGKVSFPSCTACSIF